MSHASNAPQDNRYTVGIARFVSGLRYEDIPAEVRTRIRLLILDSIGCALYGANLDWTRILQRTLTSLDATRACGVWGTHARTAHRCRGSSSTTCTARVFCTSEQWCCRR